MGNIYTHIICLLAGALIMYWLKDNFAKPDIQNDIDVNVKLKNNRLENIRNRFKRNERKKKV